jgi:hypothetical protein
LYRPRSCCIPCRLRELGRVDVCHFVLFGGAGPGDGLPHGEFVVVPDLDLIFGGIAPDEDLPLVEIDGIAGHVRPEDRPHALPLPHVPQVDHRVPTSGNYGVVVDELHRKDAVGVPAVVPLCAPQVRGHALRVCVEGGLLSSYILTWASRPAVAKCCPL